MTQRRAIWPYRSTVTMQARANGQWGKKFKGRYYYFGTIDNPERALSRWRDEWPRITAGDDPRAKPREATTVADLCRAFVSASASRAARGDLSALTAHKYEAHCVVLCGRVGSVPLSSITPADFARALASASGRFGPHRLADWVACVRSVFAWGEASGLCARVNLGPHFTGPRRESVRAHAHAAGDRSVHPVDIWALHDAAGPQFRAMILLGINAGFGPTDCATLEVGDVNLSAGMIDMLRHKTKAARRAILWPETVAAIRAVMPADGLVFRTREGGPWVSPRSNAFAIAWRKLRAAAGCPGVEFYSLRRTCATWMADVGDAQAARLIMGHVVTDVHESYIQRFPIARLRRVSDHARTWLLEARGVWTCNGADARVVVDARGPEQSDGFPATAGEP